VDGLNPKEFEKRIQALEEQMDPTPPPAPKQLVSPSTQEAIEAVIEFQRDRLWSPGDPTARLAELLQERGVRPEVAQGFAQHIEETRGQRS
jgi:hypothetical protein